MPFVHTYIYGIAKSQGMLMFSRCRYHWMVFQNGGANFFHHHQCMSFSCLAFLPTLGIVSHVILAISIMKSHYAVTLHGPEN